ncbi:hypothetical protein [Sphingomonas sp.]|uniref:hypothetical protein n=1 Tax=Sphingomonas sp. TaxID=28214 RepID=UPI003B00CD3D
MRVFLLSLLAALPAAASAPYSTPLDVAQCGALSGAAVAALGPDWSVLAAFVERCAVPGPDRRPALTVDIVRLDRAYAVDFFATHPDQTVPRPILRLPSGREVGTLPEQFPVEAPGMLKVRFVRWQRGLPREIRLYQAGESALAPHALPSLRWSPRAGGYR